MFHQNILKRFVQLDFEPLHVSWWRFKDLLDKFPNHGFSLEEKLQVFLNGLSNDARNWVEQGDGTTSFYQQSIEEAYLMLEDMV